jgi:transcriptional regulator with XRE-family HTH domain
MPRRRRPDALSAAIGKRIRDLRLEQGLTAEKLAYESDLGSKGYLSDIENGLARPTTTTLKIIADHLGVALLDLLTFPSADDRQQLIDQTRHLSSSEIRRLIKESQRHKR